MCLHKNWCLIFVQMETTVGRGKEKVIDKEFEKGVLRTVANVIAGTFSLIHLSTNQVHVLPYIEVVI